MSRRRFNHDAKPFLFSFAFSSSAVLEFRESGAFARPPGAEYIFR